MLAKTILEKIENSEKKEKSEDEEKLRKSA